MPPATRPLIISGLKRRRRRPRTAINRSRDCRTESAKIVAADVGGYPAFQRRSLRSGVQLFKRFCHKSTRLNSAAIELKRLR